MVRSISILLSGLLFWLNSYAQQKPYGYKISDNTGIVSNVFFIQEGFVLDSTTNVQFPSEFYRFEYDEQGKLKRDINFWQFAVQEGRFTRHKTGYRDYFYNDRGDVDSSAWGYWNDSMWVADSSGYTIHYEYDNDGRILSKTYPSSGAPGRIEENSYDSWGNLLLNTVIIVFYHDTTCTWREYDAQNRLTEVRSSYNPYWNRIDRNLYQYDSSGNVSHTVQVLDQGYVSNRAHYHLTFDASGKLVEVLESATFLADSTWRTDWDLLFTYDELGRIVKIGEGNSPTFWVGYDSNGNLDSLVNTYRNPYPGMPTLIDSYGNSITLPNYSGITHFHFSRLVTGVKSSSEIAKTFTLSQNYPNPFNPVTRIKYTVGGNGALGVGDGEKTGDRGQGSGSRKTRLVVYDLLGRKVATLVDEVRAPGSYEVSFDASGLASGVYFYRMTVGSYVQSRTMVLLR